MARPDDNEAAVGELKKTVAQLLALESKLLKLQEQFGPTAADAAPSVSRTADLFRKLISRDNLAEVPGTVIEELTRVVHKRMSDFNRLQNVTLQPGQGPQAWAAAVAELRQGYAEAFKVVAPIIAFLNDRRPDTESFEQEAKATLARLETLEKTYQTATVEATEKIQSTLAGVRQAAQEAGLAEYAQFFKIQADEHRTNAKRWLALLALISAATVAAAGWLFHYYLTLATAVTTQAGQASRGVVALTTAEGVQFAVAKLVLFSVLFTGLVATNRIYRAHRHNYVVNRHRENALRTLLAFANAPADVQTKNAVLMQATGCIFTPQHTGYVSHEPDAGGVAQVLEVFRSAVAPSGQH